MSIEIAPSHTFLLDKVQLRFLGPDDVEVFKILCRDWFPIEYPNGWYEEVTSGQRFFSLAATLNNEIVGVLVAEVKERRRCNKEDSNILGYWYSSDIKIAYILILGVKKQFRRAGVASLLLDSFLSQLRTDESHSCKAVYLHVLPTNSTAVNFYKKQNFQFHSRLWNYYRIDNVKMDGHCYVMYINGGEPPWNFLDVCKNAKRYICDHRILSVPFQLVLKIVFLPCFFVRGYSRQIRNM